MIRKWMKKGIGRVMVSAMAAMIVMPAVPVLAAPADIGLEAAKAAAISHSGFSADTVQIVETESDWENGAKEYEIKFIAGNYLFKYEIKAADGSVKKVAFETPKGLTPTVKPGEIFNTPIITRDQALEIALKSAGVSADAVTRQKLEGDYDDGILQYEVEFTVNGVEYSFDINALDGAILSREVDMDDDRDDDHWDDDDDDDRDDWDDDWDDDDDDHRWERVKENKNTSQNQSRRWDDDDWDDDDDDDDWDDDDDDDDD